MEAVWLVHAACSRKLGSDSWDTARDGDLVVCKRREYECLNACVRGGLAITTEYVLVIDTANTRSVEMVRNECHGCACWGADKANVPAVDDPRKPWRLCRLAHVALNARQSLQYPKIVQYSAFKFSATLRHSILYPLAVQISSSRLHVRHLSRTTRIMSRKVEYFFPF